MLSAGAALHLHLFTMQNMNDLHYFWHTWENRWLADININADRPVFKEMAAGEFWFGKISEELSEMYTKTDARTDQIREAKPFVTEMLPFVRELGSSENPEEVADEYEDPVAIMARYVAESMSSYENSFFVAPDLESLRNKISSVNY